MDEISVAPSQPSFFVDVCTFTFISLAEAFIQSNFVYFVCSHPQFISVEGFMHSLNLFPSS